MNKGHILRWPSPPHLSNRSEEDCSFAAQPLTIAEKLLRPPPQPRPPTATRPPRSSSSSRPNPGPRGFSMAQAGISAPSSERLRLRRGRPKVLAAARGSLSPWSRASAPRPAQPFGWQAEVDLLRLGSEDVAIPGSPRGKELGLSLSRMPEMGWVFSVESEKFLH